jgi:hypothetical protein
VTVSPKENPPAKRDAGCRRDVQEFHCCPQGEIVAEKFQHDQQYRQRVEDEVDDKRAIFVETFSWHQKPSHLQSYQIWRKLLHLVFELLIRIVGHLC